MIASVMTSGTNGKETRETWRLHALAGEKGFKVSGRGASLVLVLLHGTTPSSDENAVLTRMLSPARTILYSIVIFCSFLSFVLSAAFIGRTNSDFK